MRLLVVEDARRMRRYLTKALTRAGHAVDEAADGLEGLTLAELNDYDVIVLDLMLPRLDGIGVLQRLRRADRRASVIVLTARDTVSDRVAGLRSGADDYLVKPFALEELLARVEVLARRRYDRPNPVLQIDDLVIDMARRTVSRRGQDLELRPREYALLEFLAHKQGTVVSRSEIEHHLYDERAELSSNAVDAAVSRLRKKVDTPNRPSLVETRRGMGYVLRTTET